MPTTSTQAQPLGLIEAFAVVVQVHAPGAAAASDARVNMIVLVFTSGPPIIVHVIDPAPLVVKAGVMAEHRCEGATRPMYAASGAVPDSPAASLVSTDILPPVISAKAPVT